MGQVTVKEKPILFSPPMVRAILSGRKTMTRRIVKPQPPDDHPFPQEFLYRGSVAGYWWNDTEHDNDDVSFWPSYEEALICPYGRTGTRLWVRETWGLTAATECSAYKIHRGDVLRGEWDLIRRDIAWKFHYRADGEHEGMSWRPSIFMPRCASRITLEVTEVRVERLQDISEVDAEAEGVDSIPQAPAALTHRTSFAKLWDKINGKGSWDLNPWVWVVSFKRLADCGKEP